MKATKRNLSIAAAVLVVVALMLATPEQGSARGWLTGLAALGAVGCIGARLAVGRVAKRVQATFGNADLR